MEYPPQNGKKTVMTKRHELSGDAWDPGHRSLIWAPHKRPLAAVFKTVVEPPDPCGLDAEIDSKTNVKRHGYTPHTARASVSALEPIFATRPVP